VSGSGYSAGETVTLYLGGQLLKTTPATVTASSSGTWKASVKVPATTGGAHTLQVTGSASGSVYESVQVVASLRFSPAKPAAGATVTGVVEGLYPGESVTLHQGSATGPTLGSAANANASGTADVKFTAPASGTYTIYAVGNEGSSAKATLTVS
jgi:hypothetical protein